MFENMFASLLNHGLRIIYRATHINLHDELAQAMLDLTGFNKGEGLVKCFAVVRKSK